MERLGAADPRLGVGLRADRRQQLRRHGASGGGCSSRSRSASSASPTASIRASPPRQSTAPRTGAAAWSRTRRAGAGLAGGERRLRGRRSDGAGRDGAGLRRPLHRGQAPAAPDRSLRPGTPPLHHTRFAGAGRRPPRRVGGRAPDRDDRAHRLSRRLSRRLAVPRGSSRFPPRRRRPRPCLRPRAVRPGPGRGDGLRTPGDRRRQGRPGGIVDDPDTGWLVPPDDLGALADAMVEAVNDPGPAASAASARGEVVDRYAWRQIGADLAALAGELLLVRG